MNDLYYLGVKAVIKNAEGQVLLLKAKDYWDLPGGRTQLGETEQAALRRELTEETGLEVTVGRHLGMYLSTVRLRSDARETAGLIFSVYRCQATIYEVSISNEHVSYQWMSPEAAASELSGKFGPQISAMIGEV